MSYILCLGLRSTVEERQEIVNSIHNAGYKALLLDKECPSDIEKEVDLFFSCNNADEKEVLTYVSQFKENIALCLSWTDTYVTLASKISSILDIPGIPLDTVDNVRNKYKMREVISSDFPELCPKYKLVSSEEDLKQGLQVLSFPLILKPTGASGSKGIFLIHDEKQAYSAFKELSYLADNAPDRWFYTRYGREFILEEYIEGEEFSVEGYIVNGTPFFAGITDKKVTKDWSIEYHHVFPSIQSSAIQQSIHESCIKALSALKINNCPFHIEARIHNNKIKFIEIAGRIGGGLISTHLIAHATEKDWVSIILKSLIEQKHQDEKLEYKQACGIRFILAPYGGEFKEVSFAHTQKWEENIILKTIIAKEKSNIQMPPSSFNSIILGYFVAKDKDPLSCWNLLDHIHDSLEIKIECPHE